MLAKILEILQGHSKNFESIDQRFESMDKRFEAIDQRFESINQRFESIDKRFEKMEHDMRQLKLDVANMMEEQTTRIELKIENDVTRQIHALFDGYKLNREKQYELERKVDQLEQRIEKLETKAG